VGQFALDRAGVPAGFIVEAVVRGDHRSAADGGDVVYLVEKVESLELEEAGGGVIGGSQAAAADGDANEVSIVVWEDGGGGLRCSSSGYQPAGGEGPEVREGRGAGVIG